MGGFGGGRWVNFVVDSGGGSWRWAMGPNGWWILVVDFSGGLWWCSLEVGEGRAFSSTVVLSGVVRKCEV